MGDRANVVIQTGNTLDDSVWIYTHWHGHDLPGMVATALASGAARGRWGDPPYLCRILIDRIIPDHEGSTGWGISHGMGDNSYNILVVNIPSQKVFLVDWDRSASDIKRDSEPLIEWTFEEFASLDSEDLDMTKLSEIVSQK